MCGFYITNKNFSKDEVLEKVERIKFRGPDYTGYYKSNNYSLAHVRLAIIDLDSRSNQPFSYKNLNIVFNGEIYNYKSLKIELINLGVKFFTKSDTEVLLMGYCKWGGEKLLSKINGMFSFVIYDNLNDEIFAARDRIGVVPFYYSYEKNFFEAASQLKPLIHKNSVVDDYSLSLYLELGYVPSPYSMIRGVQKLLAGEYLTIKKGKLKKTIYWDLEKVKLEKISYLEAKTKLKELLKDAIKIRLNSDVPIASFLSGGIDSALISAIANELNEQPINTFTIGFEDKEYDESQTAKEYSQILGTKHNTKICEIDDILNEINKMKEVYDEPFADSSALPSLLLNKVTKPIATVALSGDGGDESFLGYNNFDNLRKIEKMFTVPFFLRRLISFLPIHLLINSKTETVKEILKLRGVNDYIFKVFSRLDRISKKEIRWYNNFKKYIELSDTNMQKLADINIKLWLEGDSNVKVDRASKAYAVEVRSPFLDYRIVEFARTLPVKYKYKEGVKKKLLKDILKDYIPEYIFNKPKKGFSIPLGDWLKKELKEDIKNTLNDKFLESVYNLNIDKFKKQLDSHLRGKYDYSHNVWKMYVLAKWFDSFNKIKNEINVK